MQRYLSLLACILLLASCSTKQNLIVLTDQREAPQNTTVAALSKALEPMEISLRENIVNANLERSLLQRVNNGEADMAIVKNDIRADESLSNIRTIMPLFPDVFIMLYRNQDNKTAKSLLAGGRVFMIIDKDEERPIMERFIKSLHCTPQHVTYVYHEKAENALAQAADQADVILMLSSLNNPHLATLLNDNGAFQLYNPDPDGSKVEGFHLQYPPAMSYTIPTGIFDGFPESPIRTFALYDVLVCNKNMEPETVYDINEYIHNARARLTQDNFEFATLQDEFNPQMFAFPVHTGTSAYLNRNQPSFWERYAEVVGLGASIIAVIAGAISRYYSRWRQRRKDRIDEYYLRVMTLGDKAHQTGITSEQLEKMLVELQNIRTHAFKLLVAERIAADDAFIIFQLLLQATVQYVESRAEKLDSVIPIRDLEIEGKEMLEYG